MIYDYVIVGNNLNSLMIAYYLFKENYKILIIDMKNKEDHKLYYNKDIVIKNPLYSNNDVNFLNFLNHLSIDFRSIGKKCNNINPNYVTDTSDPTICKQMSGTRVVKTVSRNNTSNSCNFPNTVFGSTLQGGIPKCVVTTRPSRLRISSGGGSCINGTKFSVINNNNGTCNSCFKTGLDGRQYSVRLLNNTYRCVPTGY